MSEKSLLGAFEEMVLLSVARGEGESYGMSVRRDVQSRSGRDVTIGADAQYLHVDAAAFHDSVLIPLAEGFVVVRRARWNVRVLHGDVDVLEQVLVHEVVIALRMVFSQAHILV